MELSYREAYHEISARYRAVVELLAGLNRQHEILSEAFSEAVARIKELEERLAAYLVAHARSEKKLPPDDQLPPQ